MPALAPTPQQIQGLIRRLRDKRGERPQYVGLQSGGIWQGPGQIGVDGDDYQVKQGASSLEVREYLLGAEREGQRLVILTPLSPQELGDDVVGRFCKGALIPLSAKDSLKDLFRVNGMDPFVLANRWFAEALLESIPPRGVSPVPSGFLDLETAWGLILAERVGLRPSRPDLLDLLDWSTGSGVRGLLLGLRPEVLHGFRDWIRQSAGPAGESILDCVLAGYGAEAPALGICFQVVCPEGEGAVSQELRDAAVRLERFAANKPFSAPAIQAWKKASVEYLQRIERGGGSPKAQSICDRSDWLLDQVNASQFAHLSEYSPAGFTARLKQYCEALLQGMTAPDTDVLHQLADQACKIAAHREARRVPERIHKVEMSLRLLRWLKGQPVIRSDFAEAVEQFVQEGSYVDWARYYLSFGDSLGELASAYARLLELATARREEQNLGFGRLAAEQAVLADQPGVVLIENVLKEVVAPIAKDRPALLIVLDGMSYSVFRELTVSLVHRGWQPVKRPELKTDCPVIAALPTTTERSRLCLLTGTLETENDEVAGFRKNEALAAASTRSHPPTLFLKGQLTQDDRLGLSNEVLNEIASARRVVGAVVNAVDDHLHSGDQIFVAWDLSKLPLLEQLLAAARQAGRWVVLTSDHGHVLDYQSTLRHSDAGGDRYRSADRPPEPDEVLIKGFRVGTTLGGGFVAPCSEKVYYTSRRNGYHGGVTPQELIVPLAVLVAENFDLGAWLPVPPEEPAWWNGDKIGPPIAATVTPAAAPQKPAGQGKAKPQQELPLFGVPKPPVEPARESWMDRLLSCQLFTQQCQQAGRTVPQKDQVRLILAALDERNGVILKSALSQRVQIPGLRINGVLAVLRRVLNIDGYPVLMLDEDGETVRLNRQLLLKQFELE